MQLAEFLSKRCGKKITFDFTDYYTKGRAPCIVFDGEKVSGPLGWVEDMLTWRWDSDYEVKIPELVDMALASFDSIHEQLYPSK